MLESDDADVVTECFFKTAVRNLGRRGTGRQRVDLWRLGSGGNCEALSEAV